LDELDDLAAVVAELRGLGGDNGTPRLARPTSAAKKNGESPLLAPPHAVPPPRAIRTTSQPSEPTQPIYQRVDRKHADSDSIRAASAEAGDKPPAMTDSVLAQWQQVVSSGQAVRHDAPPKASRREQLAAIADRPIIRRAMELFDVPAGQLRYTPPDGKTS
jgi:hypothetical protein